MGDSTQERRSRSPDLIVVLLAVLVVPYVFVEFVTTWPPPSVERESQRQKVLERIQSAGGWEVLQRDALLLMEQRTNYYDWTGSATNELPAAIAALKPMSVEYIPSKYLSELKDGKFTDPPKVELVRIRIFGMHSTGGHSTPYFGLEIVRGPGGKDYAPRPHDAVSCNRHTRYERVAEDIYEIY